MKTPAQVMLDVRRRVANHWHNDLTSASTTWPHAFPLGAVSKADLETRFSAYQKQSFEWGDWTASKKLLLTSTPRRVAGTNQAIPTHVTVADLDTAARLLGGEWVNRVERGRARAAILTTQFPHLVDLGKIVRAVDGYTDTDFNLLCVSARWFAQNTATGLTPRQVPIEGLHAKWLNTSKAQLRTLAGVGDLGLLGAHPHRAHFTYLDPVHLAAGGRKHDSATVGDTFTPAYRPDTVIISENKDTAIYFPDLTRAISMEGVGSTGHEVISTFDWVTSARRLIYWGDMDAAGLEIVNTYRQSGVPVTTILMDFETFETYERFGSATDLKGVPLTAGIRKNLPSLTTTEYLLYRHLTDPAWTRTRRIEQERIPLAVALAAVMAI